MDAAARAAEFVVTKMRGGGGGRLMRSFKDGRGAQPGYLEDYAFAAAGLFDLVRGVVRRALAAEALALVAETEALFADTARGWLVHDQRPPREAAGARASELSP